MSNNFEPNDYTGMFDTSDIEQNKMLALVCYIPLLFWIPLVAGGDSKFAKFHSNQGLILTIFSFAASVVTRLIDFVIDWIPVIGGFVSGVISAALGIAVVAGIIIGIINSAQGKAKKLPLIGELFDIIK
ncbi:MAG: hypothetical protein NC320_13580 [Clostridium sp.]|nr:hypothetical protein [Clostridium sp.]MCM1548321.1 hypothetical protein [Ruminococcus sp.]